MVLNIPFWVKHFSKNLGQQKKQSVCPLQLGHRSPKKTLVGEFSPVDCVKIKVMIPSKKMNSLPSLKLTANAPENRPLEKKIPIGNHHF